MLSYSHLPTPKLPTSVTLPVSNLAELINNVRSSLSYFSLSLSFSGGGWVDMNLMKQNLIQRGLAEYKSGLLSLFDRIMGRRKGYTNRHRWELPVVNYHGIRGNYHYPFFWVIFLVILHDFIWKNYHRNQSDRYPFFLIMVNYPTFLINDHILNFQMYYQYLFFLPKYPNNVSKKNQNSAIFGIEVLIEMTVSDF